MSKTVYLLFAQYERAVLPLDDICEEHFGLSRCIGIKKPGHSVKI